MKLFRLSHLVLFLYDIVRLGIIVGIMTRLGKLSLGDASYPYLVYASSQALFPIMSWFFYIDTETYRAYLPLNIAGKCVFIILTGIWAFYTIPELSAMAFDLFVGLGLTLIIVFTDIMSILGMIFIKKGLEKSDKNEYRQNDAYQIDEHRHEAENDTKTDSDIGGMECE